MGKILKNFRQGEVLIHGIIKKDNRTIDAYGFKPKADNVIIEGELAGHKHAVENGKLYEKGDKIVLEAGKGCLLTHPEHKPIPIPEGIYEIVIQVEYDEDKHKTKVKD